MEIGMENIVEILEQQVINKTLSLEGISHVQRIIDENKQLHKDNEHLAKSLRDEKESNKAMYEKLDTTQRTLTEVQKELGKYQEKDKTYYEQSIKFQYEEKRGNEFKEILGMALRNTVIRQNMYGGQMNGNTGIYENKDETITKEEE